MTDFDDPKQLEDYKRAMFALFRQKGWKHLMAEMGELREEIDRVAGIRDNDELKFRQGQLNIIARIESAPDNVERIGADEEAV